MPEQVMGEKWHPSWADFGLEFDYEETFEIAKLVEERAEAGPILLKGKKRPLSLQRQGKLRAYAVQSLLDFYRKTQFWMRIFNQELRTKSGRHVHQGGLAIFVVDGKGYSVVDGIRHDWEKGDLVLLPIKVGGVEHQHFNLDPGKPAIWLALIPHWIWELTGRIAEQKENHPEFKGPDKS